MNEKDLILIGGKAYKKCKVVILPTKDKPEIGNLCSNNVHPFFIWTNAHEAGDVQNTLVEYKNTIVNHLFSLSNEKIKEGDWAIGNDNKPYQLKTEQFALRGDRKIIATTDKSLLKQVYSSNGNTIMAESSYPRPSDNFLKAYCKVDGKIDEVLVEYINAIPPDSEGFVEVLGFGKVHIANFPLLKLAPDNTITIKRVELSIEEAADDYAFSHGMITEVMALSRAFEAGVEWAKQNLNQTK